MKSKSVCLNEILTKELRDNDFNLLLDEDKFYLQIAHIVSD